MSDASDLEIVELARLLDDGAVSPVELCRHFLDRIEALDPVLNAFLNWDPALALEQARRAEGRRRVRRRIGPLDGIPIAVKDNIATKDLPTTAGSAAGLRIGREDAAVVSALRAGGAVVLGKTNLPELAYGPTDDYVFGPTRNPWDPGRYAGGSSMGSGAAVAAGLAPGALGTDTTGSARHPANWCGVVGLKPTRGRLPLSGVVPLATSLDHVGLLARSARDCRLLLAVAQASRAVPAASPDALLDLRIGVVQDPGWDALPAAVRTAVDTAVDVLRSLGAAVVDTAVSRWDSAVAAAETVLAREAATRYGPLLARDEGAFGPDLRAKLLAGAEVTGREYVEAKRLAAAFHADLAEAMRGLDLVLTPGRERAAPRMDGAGRILDDPVGLRCSAPLNLVGWPALALPCGFDETGLPVGLQLVARPWAEDGLLRVGEAFQEVTDWHRRRPPLPIAGSEPARRDRTPPPCSVGARVHDPADRRDEMGDGST